MSEILDKELENQIEEDVLEPCLEDRVYTSEEVVSIVEEIMPKVELNTELLNDLELDIDEFKRGIKDASFMAGQYSALRSVGLGEEFAYNIILNESTSRGNLELGKINSKQQTVQTEMNQI